MGSLPYLIVLKFMSRTNREHNYLHENARYTFTRESKRANRGREHGSQYNYNASYARNASSLKAQVFCHRYPCCTDGGRQGQCNRTFQYLYFPSPFNGSLVSPWIIMTMIRQMLDVQSRARFKNQSWTRDFKYCYNEHTGSWLWAGSWNPITK